MNKIMLNDILNLDETEIEKAKIKFNISNGYEDPLELYKENPDKVNNIITKQKTGWIPALQNQKAVYLINDTNTGKLYVGSATSQYGMLLQRWSDYIANGHGGNKGLKDVVNSKGFDYVKKYFQYSILENYNAKMDDNYILKREKWWKDTLKSREFGMNEN